jgi:hypothetical protein
MRIDPINELLNTIKFKEVFYIFLKIFFSNNFYTFFDIFCFRKLRQNILSPILFLITINVPSAGSTPLIRIHSLKTRMHNNKN